MPQLGSYTYLSPSKSHYTSRIDLHIYWTFGPTTQSISQCNHTTNAWPPPSDIRHNLFTHLLNQCPRLTLLLTSQSEHSLTSLVHPLHRWPCLHFFSLLALDVVPEFLCRFWHGNACEDKVFLRGKLFSSTQNVRLHRQLKFDSAGYLYRSVTS